MIKCASNIWYLTLIPGVLAAFMFITLPVSASPSASVFRVGADINYFDYEEPGVMQESGYLFGISGSYESAFELHRACFMRISGSLVWGDLEYDGAVISPDGSTEPVTADTPNSILNLRAVAGPLSETGRHTILPFLGLGYRLLVDDLSDPSPEFGYTREQTYVYIPVGVEYRYETDGRVTASILVEYDVWLAGENYSHGGALGGGITLDQGSGHGFRASAGISKPRSDASEISVSVYVESWNVDDSDPSGGFFEPENDSVLFGVKASISL